MGGKSPGLSTPPVAPSPTGAAKLIENKIPNQNKTGLDSTILTQPSNALAQDQALQRRKTLLGE